MLASIHPLGERARHQRFAVTLIAYAFASVVAAGAFGALLGAIGRSGFGSTLGTRGLVLAGAAAAAAAVDRSPLPIPSWHRQVNEDWLVTYRGWIYGLGFGAQLGLGVVTIVTTAAVYLTWIAAFAAASPWIGALVGAAFGLARALPVISGVWVGSPTAIGERVRRLHAWDGRFRVMTVLVETTAAMVAVILAVR